jgi:hypothetical protein
MRKRIVWKRWIDPLAPENDKDKGVLELDPEEGYTDSYDMMERDDKKASSPTGPVLISPLGVIPLNEHNLPSKVFNFWMGHTNFDIGEDEAKIINDAPGVETLDIFTRYRFRISVGKAFDEYEVMDTIGKILCKEVIVEKKDSLDRIQKHLSSNYAFWAIFVLPNGEIDYKTGDTQESVKEKIASYPQKKAKILTSWELNNEKKPISKKESHGRGI